ncbi:hypothetical protein C8R47DRAFT_313329 [Mycena vitilis]|nr:hypothetical protein C8R47DRAFT_313329 [Mycena vitilis]
MIYRLNFSYLIFIPLCGAAPACLVTRSAPPCSIIQTPRHHTTRESCLHLPLLSYHHSLPSPCNTLKFGAVYCVASPCTRDVGLARWRCGASLSRGPCRNASSPYLQAALLNDLENKWVPTRIGRWSYGALSAATSRREPGHISSCIRAARAGRRLKPLFPGTQPALLPCKTGSASVRARSSPGPASSHSCGIAHRAQMVAGKFISMYHRARYIPRRPRDTIVSDISGGITSASPGCRSRRGLRLGRTCVHPHFRARPSHPASLLLVTSTALPFLRQSARQCDRFGQGGITGSQQCACAA